MNTIQRDFVLVFRIETDAYQILLVPSETGYDLPLLQTDYHFWQSCEAVERGVREQLGFTAYTLRCLSVEHVPGEPSESRCVYAMQWAGRRRTGWVALADPRSTR
jgi:hypothetical protein